MAGNFFNGLRKKAEEAVQKARDEVKDLPETIKKARKEAAVNRETNAYQRKLEKQWAPIKAKALSEIKNAKDAIQIQLKNEVVENYTRSLMEDVDDLEQTIREAAPDDTCSLCEELLEKYTEDLIPISAEGNTDERARDNEKIRRVYKRVRQLLEKVKVIMTPPEKETEDKK